MEIENAHYPRQLIHHPCHISQKDFDSTAIHADARYGLFNVSEVEFTRNRLFQMAACHFFVAN